MSAATYQIESHDDDSVTLTVGALTATIRGDTYRDAFETARALAGILTARVDLATLTARTAGLRQAIGEIDSTLDALDRATVDAHAWAVAVCEPPKGGRP